MTKKYWKRRANKRPPPRREQFPKHFIFTEGETEQAYLSHFKTTTGPQVAVAARNGLPLIKYCIQQRNDLIRAGDYDEQIDQMWAVFDRDKTPENAKDKEQFNSAVALAKREDIQIACSNDSFELWYLLHFQDVESAVTRRDLVTKLGKKIGRSYKSGSGSKVEDLYAAVRDRQHDAIGRAVRMHAQLQRSDTPLEAANPSTTMHRLLLELMKDENFKQEDPGSGLLT